MDRDGKGRNRVRRTELLGMGVWKRIKVLWGCKDGKEWALPCLLCIFFLYSWLAIIFYKDKRWNIMVSIIKVQVGSGKVEDIALA